MPQVASPEPSLVVGRKLRCPNCEELWEIFQLKPLDRIDRYAKELNAVYQCRKDKGGCGHVFSPGEPMIFVTLFQSFLRGEIKFVEQDNFGQASSNGSHS